MDNQELITAAKNDLEKIQRKIDSAIRKDRANTALTYIKLAADIQSYFQFQETDHNLERDIQILGDRIDKCAQNDNRGDENNYIALYDAQGLEYRGLAWIYIQSLITQGYKILYITLIKQKNSVSNLERLVKSNGGEVEFLDSQNLEKQVRQIRKVLNSYCIRHCFIHTFPSDVVIFVALQKLSTKCKSTMISLEDHGFVLGTDTVDEIIEFRNYGYTMSLLNRGVPKDKIKLLPYYPLDNHEEFQGFDFSCKGKKMIFSGGSVYKIKGSNKFFQIIEHILKKYGDSIFVFAGTGVTSEFDELKDKYNSRVYTISERTDLIEVLKRCYLYLSTYPVGGGLMVQYAAKAGRLPLTLNDYNDPESDLRSLLGDTTISGVFFDSMDSMINAIDLYMENPSIKSEKEEELKKTLIDGKDFSLELKKIMNGENTKYISHSIELRRDIFRKRWLSQVSFEKYCRIFFNHKRINFCVFTSFTSHCIKAVRFMVREKFSLLIH